MIDLYSKVVLTVIAAALTAIAVQGVVPGAIAQGMGCGTTRNPCEITGTVQIDGKVKIDTGMFGLPVTLQR